MYLGTVVYCRQCGQAVVYGYYRGGSAPYDPWTSLRHFCGAQTQDADQPLMRGLVDGRHLEDLVFSRCNPMPEPERIQQRTPVRTPVRPVQTPRPPAPKVVSTEITIE